MRVLWNYAVYGAMLYQNIRVYRRLLTERPVYGSAIKFLRFDWGLLPFHTAPRCDPKSGQPRRRMA